MEDTGMFYDSLRSTGTPADPAEDGGHDVQHLEGFDETVAMNYGGHEEGVFYYTGKNGNVKYNYAFCSCCNVFKDQQIEMYPLSDRI